MAITSKKVLYIEDDPEARYMMADIIRYKGYTYLEASRGLEGIHLADKHKPDLILIDLRLPDMQGYEVTTHLKSLPGLESTPIIALTAQTQKEVKELVLTAGCDGYIPKPINITEFLFKIEEFLAGKKEHLKPADEKEYLQKYNIQLVSRLKKKISELEQLNIDLSNLNKELFTSREELSKYNDRLFYLNNVANYLRTLRDPGQLVDALPKKIIEGFEADRCLLLELSPKSLNLKVLSLAGISRSTFKNLKLKLSPQLVRHLKQEGGILWIKDSSEILDKSLDHLSEQLNAGSFIFGNLANLGTQNDSTEVIRRLTKESDIDDEIQYSKRIVFFIDKGKTNKSFATYEIRILKSFMQTVGIIYENMVLYTRLIQMYQIKSQEAIRDGLTKVYNYRYFVQELDREANRNRRYHNPFSLLMIDIDHFKEFNDAKGHLEGDRALRHISKILDKNTRTTDTVARYGGEEFTVILPGLNKKDAQFIAEKLRTLVEEFCFSDGPKGKNCFLTISIGVAHFPDDSDDPKLLMKKADEALYQAKENGRNKVCLS